MSKSDNDPSMITASNNYHLPTRTSNTLLRHNRTVEHAQSGCSTVYDFVHRCMECYSPIESVKFKHVHKTSSKNRSLFLQQCLEALCCGVNKQLSKLHPKIQMWVVLHKPTLYSYGQYKAVTYFFLVLPRTATPAVVTPPAASWTLTHFSASKGTFECLES